MKKILFAAATMLLLASCVSDSDTAPVEKEEVVIDTTEATVETCSTGRTRGTGDDREKCIDGAWESFPAPTTTLPPPTTTTIPVPTIEDFIVDLIVLEDKCFNSAGGLVTISPNLTFLGLYEFTGDAVVSYRVDGGEYPETYSLELSNGSYTYREPTISTVHCGDILTATVVGVLIR